MISCRILGCVVLIAFSQYVDASRDLESILASALQPIKEAIAKLAEQSTMRCNALLVPIEEDISKLFQHHILNENSEKSVDHKEPDNVLQPPKNNQKKNRRNDNINANVNENVNANINTNRYHRRSLIGDPRFFDGSQNMNSNFNFNSNSNKNVFDYSDEDAA